LAEPIPEALTVTGISDTDYDLIAFAHRASAEAARLETYVEDAQLARDSRLAEFFAREQAAARRAALEARRLLASPGHHPDRHPAGGDDRSADPDSPARPPRQGEVSPARIPGEDAPEPAPRGDLQVGATGAEPWPGRDHPFEPDSTGRVLPSTRPGERS
jgi:hypothetical protein